MVTVRFRSSRTAGPPSPTAQAALAAILAVLNGLSDQDKMIAIGNAAAATIHAQCKTMSQARQLATDVRRFIVDSIAKNRRANP